MSVNTEQRLAFAFGLLGGLLVALGGLVSLVVGVAYLVMGRSIGAINAESEAVLLFVVGGLAIFFAWLGHRDQSTRPLTSAIVLIALAVVGWAVVGLGASLLGVVGALFVFLAGLLYLVDPATKAVKYAVATP